MTLSMVVLNNRKEMYGFHTKCTWINSIVIVSANKTGNKSTGTTLSMLKVKMPNMHFNSQI